jgi:hypothetical protein
LASIAANLRASFISNIGRFFHAPTLSADWHGGSRLLTILGLLLVKWNGAGGNERPLLIGRCRRGRFKGITRDTSDPRLALDEVKEGPERDANEAELQKPRPTGPAGGGGGGSPRSRGVRAAFFLIPQARPGLLGVVCWMLGGVNGTKSRDRSSQATRETVVSRRRRSPTHALPSRSAKSAVTRRSRLYSAPA